MTFTTVSFTFLDLAVSNRMVTRPSCTSWARVSLLRPTIPSSSVFPTWSRLSSASLKKAASPSGGHSTPRSCNGLSLPPPHRDRSSPGPWACPFGPCSHSKPLRAPEAHPAGGRRAWKPLRIPPLRPATRRASSPLRGWPPRQNLRSPPSLPPTRSRGRFSHL